MMQDAEAHAEEDRKAVELVQARNMADNMIHTVEKTITDLGDQVTDEEKAACESAIKDLEAVKDDNDVEVIQEKTNALMEASHQLTERLYAQQAGEAGAEGGPDFSGGADAGFGGAQSGDDVVDAEFEEVKDDK